MLLVDAANVIGSRPTGWWRDRAGAARTFVAQLRDATATKRLSPPVVVVLEGDARAGVPEGTDAGVEVVHAAGEGDETLVRIAAAAGEPVVLVSADRALADRVHATGGMVTGPTWLLERLEG